MWFTTYNYYTVICYRYCIIFVHKYGCIHINDITNTEKVLDIPSKDMRIICRYVMRELKMLQLGVTILR